MQARLQHHLVLDVETITQTQVVFDIAWSLGTKDAILNTKNYIVQEIYSLDNIRSCPFHGERKAQRYEEMLQSGKVTLEYWKNILLVLYEDILEYSPIIWAYNVPFDCRAICTTNRIVRRRSFKMFNKSKIFDLYTAWCLNVAERKDYRRFCLQNGYVSKAGNVQTKAETAIRFVRQDPEYSEQHTAGQDTVDEFEILQWLIRRKKRRNVKAMPHPWKFANPKM